MRFLISQVRVDGIAAPGHVLLTFDDAQEFDLDLKSARTIGRALLDQADIAELEALRAK